jgi:general secretion pathway protein A
MYKAFYGFQRNPFEISPDPRFFFGTTRHNEALASLWHGVERRKGFIVVTGEVGTGKTLVAKCLAQWLSWTKTPFAYVFNPLLSPVEFLKYVVDDLGIAPVPKTKGELLADFNRYLISQHHRNSTAVLIIDEAQLLSWELLEEVRLLTNLETSQQKLLQIVLIGQTELDAKLDSQDLRQLKQRISLRCRLDALSLAETQKYISVRLMLAGSKKKCEEIFPPETIELIQVLSRGIPRLINVICEAALIAGFAVKTPSITSELIAEVAADFRLESHSKPEANVHVLSGENRHLSKVSAAAPINQAAAASVR